MSRYDVAVIGGGPAGYKSALKLAEFGKKVCIVEKNENLGGTCLNEGCIPVKSLLKSADVYKTVTEASEYGVSAENSGFDIRKIYEKMRANRDQLRAGLAATVKKAKVDVINGEAVFEDSHTIRIGSGNLSADYFILAVGSEASELPDIRSDGEKILTSREMLEHEDVPGRLLIIGGGVIGCEFASFYSRLGAEVTIVEPMQELIPNEDAEAGRTLRREFKKAGIKIDTGSVVKSVSTSQDGVSAVISGKKDREELFDLVLLAVGRHAALDGLALEKAGVTTENGHIKVNEYMQTDVSHIYAAGDAADGWMLAHTAYDEGVCAAYNIAGGSLRRPERTAVPRIVFSSPEIGAVGKTEEQAAEICADVKVYKSLFKPNGKALIEGAVQGFVKIIADNGDGTVLGAVFVGKYATELVYGFLPVVKNRLKVSDISDCVCGHPTLHEAVGDALS